MTDFNSLDETLELAEELANAMNKIGRDSLYDLEIVVSSFIEDLDFDALDMIESKVGVV